MSHLLRCLIAVLAVAGLAYPSVTPRQTRGRSSGVTRGHRLRGISQAYGSHSPAIQKATDLKLLSLGHPGQDGDAVAALEESVRWPIFAPATELLFDPERTPVQQSARTNFGRAPPL